MKRHFAIAAATLAAFALPGSASADDPLTYQDLVHCAATNIVIASVLSLDDGAVKNKTEIDAFTNQAAALMTVATTSSKKDAKVVQDDIRTESTALIDVVSDKDKSKAFIEKDVLTCNDLGKAALQVLNEDKPAK